ncbi:hypothetical protein, partial [Floridanema evergladense]
MVSQSKLNQIPLELKRHGIEPTQQHVDAVAAILQSDGRASVSSAVRRYAQSQNQNQQTGETATKTTANTSRQDDLQNLSTNIGDRIAEGVISQAVNHAMKRILSGDWTLNSQAKESLENAKQTLDVEFSTISENFLS